MLSDVEFAKRFEKKYPKSIAISHRDYLKERCEGKKIYIYGTGELAQELKNYLRINSLDVAAFLDDNIDTKIDNIQIFNPIEVLYQKEGSFFVILAKDDESYGISREKFLNIGLIEDIDFTYYTEIPGTNELFHYDVSLSFSRVRQKYQGFEVFGDESNQNAIRIVALGGSTTECSLFYVKGWVRFLVDYLHENGIPAVVYGGGVSSYTSSQELLKLIRDVIPLNPDIVISYSGVNDLYSFPKPEELQRYRRPFITRFQVQFINDILDRLTKEVGIPVVNAPSWNQKGHTTAYFGLQNDKSSAQFWIDNMRMMNRLCEEFGIKFYSFFQPFRFNGVYKSSRTQQIIHSRRDLTCIPEDEGQKRWGDSVKSEVEKIRRTIKDYDFIKDFSGIFNNETNVFYDTTHVYEKGNIIIAKNILETILPQLLQYKSGKAYSTLSSRLVEYKNQDKKLETKKEIVEAIDFTNLSDFNKSNFEHSGLTNNIVQFGDRHWYVLARNSNYALILCKDAVGKSNYHDSLCNITWKNSLIRRKLNNEFYNSFSKEDQSRIMPVLLHNNNNSEYESEGGNDTIDNIFLLSENELNIYLSNTNIQTAKLNEQPIWWWLRTPGIYSDRAMAVHEKGYSIGPGYYIRSFDDKAGSGVRPALLLKL